MELTLTKSMQETVALALERPSFKKRHKEEADQVIKYDVNEKKWPISVELLAHVSKCLNRHFHELLVGTQFYTEPKEPKPKNPEFEAYMNKLRQQQQKREYNNMVSSVVTSEDQKFNLGIQPDELREVKSHIATIFNILFSMVAVYIAVYKASKTIVDDIGIQVLMSLAGALLIGIMEVILYVKYAYTATNEKKKKNKKIATL